ncbi:MAG: Veg family protein [Clostridiales bacterium]|nr:Veg family protein [Clostridiales bacterium]
MAIIDFMRARATSIEEVKTRIRDLRGKNLRVSVNKGRKKTIKLDGVITDIFPSVFMFRSATGDTVSFSYSDVICGDIKLDA